MVRSLAAALMHTAVAVTAWGQCLPYPAGFIPFHEIHAVTRPNGAGDRLVVGRLPMPGGLDAINAQIPLPAASGQQFCEARVQLGPGRLFAKVYVPTAAERNGNYSAFTGVLIDPLTGAPFPGGIIPTTRLGGVYAWRIGPAQQFDVAEMASTLVNERILYNTSVFYLYRDADSGYNHGFFSGLFPGALAHKLLIDTACVPDAAGPQGCATSNLMVDSLRGTVVRLTFAPLAPGEFVGVNAEEPEHYGANPRGVGYDLRGTTRVCFDAVAPRGAVNVQFGVAQKMAAYMTIPTSWVSLCLDLASLGVTSNDLAQVHFPFTVVTNGANTPGGGTLLLDNIRFEPLPTSQRNALGLPPSNRVLGVLRAAQVQPGRVKVPPDQAMANLATVYESAMVVLALLSSGFEADAASARIIADTLEYALRNDNEAWPLPAAPDGSAGLHRGMFFGDIGLFNDQSPGAARRGQVRLAGFSLPGGPCANGFCLVLDGATGGDCAFAMLALTAAHASFGDAKYLAAARTLGRWIHGNLYDASGTGYGGYYTGYPDEGLAKVRESGKSTENNADIYRAFAALGEALERLGQTAEAAQWNQRARFAGDFVIQMFDAAAGRFHAGTAPVGSAAGPGITPNGPQRGNDIINTFDFLDSQSFPALAMAASAHYRDAIDWRRPVRWMRDHFAITVAAGGKSYSGFGIVNPPTAGPAGVAWEFTGQAVVTMRYIDALFGGSEFQAVADQYLAEIRKAQQEAPYGDGAGLVAATMEGGTNVPPWEQCVSTPFQCVAARVGLAATTWAMLADWNVNPFELRSIGGANWPTAQLVSPEAGSGAGRTFTALYRDPDGAGDMQFVQALWAADPGGGGASFCLLHYDVAGNGLWLYTEAGFFAGPVTPGALSNLLQTGLCALETGSATARLAGTSLALTLPVVFKQAGARSVYLRAYDRGGRDTGWIAKGAWTAAAAPPPALAVDPASGSGSAPTIVATYADPPQFAGFNYGWIQFLVAAASNGGGQPFCFVHYDRAGNGLWLYSNDVGFFLGPVAPGASSSLLTSSACQVDTAATAVTKPGGVWRWQLRLNFKPPMGGARRVFQRVLDSLKRDSGWAETGTWTIP